MALEQLEKADEPAHRVLSLVALLLPENVKLQRPSQVKKLVLSEVLAELMDPLIEYLQRQRIKVSMCLPEF